MLDAFIIDYLKRRDQSKKKDSRIPLQIPVPSPLDGYRDMPKNPKNDNDPNFDYDINDKSEEGVIIIDMVGCQN